MWHSLIATGLEAFNQVVEEYNASQDRVVVVPSTVPTAVRSKPPVRSRAPTEVTRTRGSEK